MLLSAQFQGFCRDLHSECVDYFVQGILSVPLQKALRTLLLQNRKLDVGNPNPGNIGADFGRFGIPFWESVEKLDLRNEGRRDRLEQLNNWRNAIAHEDFNPTILRTSILRLERVGEWRNACYHLASCFDEVMRTLLQKINGVSPW